MNIKSWVIIVSSAILLLTGCGGEEGKEKMVPLVKTVTIGKESTEKTSSFSGTIHGRTEQALAFQIPGKVVQKLVQAGDYVQEGTPLYKLDSKDVSEQASAAQGQLTAASAQLDLARSNLARYEELYAQDAISAMQIDQARNAAKLASAQRDQAEAAYNRALNQESFATLKADRSGVVGSTMVEVGQVVAAGTPVVMLVDTKDLDVQISLTEKNAKEYPIGTRAEITFWSQPDLKISGVVREVSPAPNPKTGTYDAKIALTKVPDSVQLGMTAEVHFQKDAGKTITIPLSAMAEQQQQPSVWVVRGDKVHLVPVTPGRYLDDSVEITSGLAPGDIVVTAGTQHLHEGDKVRL